MTKPTTNGEGMTWSEWWRAAWGGGPVGALRGDVANRMLAAWRRGEDPSEWAAEQVARNPAGMSWIDWWSATGLSVAHINVDTVHDVTAAFKRGDAPADYARAAIERDEHRRMRHARPGACDAPDAPCPLRQWYDTSAETK